MKAVRIHELGGLQELVYEEVPRPKPNLGEALVQVYATGITPAKIATHIRSIRSTFKSALSSTKQTVGLI